MSKSKAIILAAFIVIIAGALLYLARPSNQASTVNSGQLKVVAGENFWGNIASQLGGKYVHVTSIISDPNADPHLYESSAEDASAVATSDVTIVNGLGYDDFMDKLLSSSPSSSRQVIKIQDVLGKSEGDNQHMWYDIPRVEQVASTITNAFVSKDPFHKNTYQDNLSAFDSSLQPIITLMNQVTQQYAGTPVAYTEPVPGYLLNDMHLDVATPEGFAKSIEDGTDPSPSDTMAMNNLIQNKSVKVLLYNAQATSPVTENVKAIAKQVGIPVIGVTETLPANEATYQSWQKDQIEALLKALQS